MALPAPNYDQILQQSQQQQTSAVQPAIQSLESQREPLKQRYDSLIQQLADREKTEVASTNTNTSREFGRRGIPLSSGVFDTTLQERIQPIGRFYAGQTSQATSDRELGLADLASRIAGLQTGASQNALQAALSRYGNELGAFQTEQENARQRSSASSLAQRQLNAQATAAREAQALLSGKEQQSRQAGALNYLTGAAYGNPNTTVDSKELDAAYTYLLSQNVSQNEAKAIIKSAFAQQGLTPYQLSQQAHAFYGI